MNRNFGCESRRGIMSGNNNNNYIDQREMEAMREEYWQAYNQNNLLSQNNMYNGDYMNEDYVLGTEDYFNENDRDFNNQREHKKHDCCCNRDRNHDCCCKKDWNHDCCC
ncbi:hypothetical protein, partial [Clostridium sp. CCUG 7971]|uniref:hypothetical protein n=1 Tax=Clostridium sp. CCUG 7971 TaxID=2811414 RepID=UPI001ABADA11